MGALTDELTVYELFGVLPTVSDAELRRAYLAKVRPLHPDRNDDPEAKRELLRINSAWQSVNQPGRRAEYDLWISAEAARRLRAARTAQVRVERLEREEAAHAAMVRQRAEREAQREEAINATLARQEAQRQAHREAAKRHEERLEQDEERAAIQAAMAAVHARPAPPPPPPPPKKPRPRVKKETVQRATKVALDILDAFLGGKK